MSKIHDNQEVLNVLAAARDNLARGWVKPNRYEYRALDANRVETHSYPDAVAFSMRAALLVPYAPIMSSPEWWKMESAIEHNTPDLTSIWDYEQQPGLTHANVLAVFDQAIQRVKSGWQIPEWRIEPEHWRAFAHPDRLATYLRALTGLGERALVQITGTYPRQRFYAVDDFGMLPRFWLSGEDWSRDALAARRMGWPVQADPGCYGTMPKELPTTLPIGTRWRWRHDGKLGEGRALTELRLTLNCCCYPGNRTEHRTECCFRYDGDWSEPESRYGRMTFAGVALIDWASVPIQGVKFAPGFKREWSPELVTVAALPLIRPREAASAFLVGALVWLRKRAETVRRKEG